MFDIKPQVLDLLRQIEGVTISDTYPRDWTKLPHISFYEQQNRDYLQSGTEQLSEIVIQIDIWHRQSTGSLAEQVNNKITSIGFKREFAADVPDPSGIKHKTMRYRGIVDEISLLVYQ